jgi:hypothetical protein
LRIFREAASHGIIVSQSSIRANHDQRTTALKASSHRGGRKLSLFFVARPLDEGQAVAPGRHRGEFNRVAKNYYSGGIVAEETATDAHTCKVQVHHDPEHLSAIQLPLR